jgi:ATP-dependent Clp protease ATP-binding subunit ClpA
VSLPTGEFSRILVVARPTHLGESRVFERFTESSIKVLMLAQEEVKLLGHNCCGTEHIFLGLIGLGQGVASLELRKGTTLAQARNVVEEVLGRVDDKRPWWQKLLGSFKEIPFTAGAEECLQLAWEEARNLKVNYIGPEHLLFAVIRLSEEKKLELLQRLQLDASSMRESVIRTIQGRNDG